MNLPKPLELLEKYFIKNAIAFEYMRCHSEKVAEKAIEIASHNKELNIDLEFIYVGSMLHDIGVCKVNAPGIGCFGKFPYICHTYLGREIMEYEGYPKLALICERHIGVGLSKENIVSANLPLPARDMIPISDEEKIISLADKFYSKSAEFLKSPKPIELIKKELEKFGQGKHIIFDSLIKNYCSYML